jgi:hypothetical protein
VAAPGSVTVSQQIFDQVKRAACLKFENLGEHCLKNIPEPLRDHHQRIGVDCGNERMGPPDKDGPRVDAQA